MCVPLQLPKRSLIYCVRCERPATPPPPAAAWRCVVLVVRTNSNRSICWDAGELAEWEDHLGQAKRCIRDKVYGWHRTIHDRRKDYRLAGGIRLP
jgi:hypothetical protein